MPASTGCSGTTPPRLPLRQGRRVRDLCGSLLDLLMPQACVGCRRPGSSFCSDCQPGTVLHHDLAGLQVVAAGAYEGGLRSAVLAYKERGRRDLARPLADLLAVTINEHRPTSDVVLVPIPSSRSAARVRGGDHMLRVTRLASRRTVLPVSRSLHLTRTVLDSAGLDPERRRTNLEGAFSALAPPRGFATALIVDDIFTTGATFGEARRVLSAAGWEVCGAATVALTPLRWAKR